VTCQFAFQGEVSRAELMPGKKVSPYYLTPRETEVLGLITQGFSNREISEGLYISPSTLKNHITRIYKKLDVTHRSQAVGLAVRLQLV
jgi:ATP/maltotriose-dependent transcriptional regulator MalT